MARLNVTLDARLRLLEPVIGEFLQSRGDGRLVKSLTMPVPPI
jgi:hypothetical protein